MMIEATAHVAIAHCGSAVRISRNACSRAEHRNECNMATARPKDTCTVGSQLVGNVTLPGTPICGSVSCASPKAGAASAAKRRDKRVTVSWFPPGICCEWPRCTRGVSRARAGPDVGRLAASLTGLWPNRVAARQSDSNVWFPQISARCPEGPELAGLEVTHEEWTVRSGAG